MCMRSSQVLPYQRWHWAGDEIVPDSTIPANRRLVGKRRRPWKIDVRRYLTAPSNSVISGVITNLRKSLPSAEREIFTSRSPGTFDSRRALVVDFFGRFHYRSRGRIGHEWLLPEETLALNGGDCEDLAFLLATLLEASGISPYCIRVAFGAVLVGGKPHDHAWVVYQNEKGGWEIIEPLSICAEGRKKARSRRQRSARPTAPPPDIEYVPVAVFNTDHLWWVRTNQSASGADLDGNLALDGYLEQREFWSRFKPAFAASVHDGIIDDALPGVSWFQRQRLKWASFALDVDTLSYDPRDHFDFSYIDEGWARVRSRLARSDLTSLAYALHSICDFYAHTVYAEFAPIGPAGIRLYDPEEPFDASAITYDFAPYAPIEGTSRTPVECADLWRGKLISGQWWRAYSTFPDDLQYRGDLEDHRSLPDHDFVAVDKASHPGGRHRYGPGSFEEQFRLRRHAAVQHVRRAYAGWRAAQQ